MGRNIFVSYVNQDRPMVDTAVAHLRRMHLITSDDNVFLDYDSRALGDTFRDATREALTDADTVLVIWSPSAAASKWVNYELGMADALDKQVIVVVPKGYSADLPAELRTTELIKLPDG